MVKLKTYKTYCGIIYENPRQYSGHITSCVICKNKIKEEKENWSVKCKCGCGKITKYKKEFYSRECYYGWKKNDIELKNRISKSVKKLYENPEYRKFISDRTKIGMKKYIEQNKHKFKYNKYKRKTNTSIELSDLLSKIVTLRWADVDYKKRISDKLKLVNIHNNERRKISIKKMWDNRTKIERIEIGKKISKIKSINIANGVTVIKHGRYKKGYYKNEWYDSSYELKRMKQLDDLGIKWTKKHGIVIKYIDEAGKERNYIPDFLIDNYQIEEVKGWLKENDILKAEYAINYCKMNNYNYIFMLGKDFEIQENLSWQ